MIFARESHKVKWSIENNGIERSTLVIDREIIGVI
jgi:hypothetical protein